MQDNFITKFRKKVYRNRYIYKFNFNKVIRSIYRNKNIERDKKIESTVKYIQYFYNNNNKLDMISERYNYLCYLKNMSNGILSGIIGTLIILSYTWLIDIFAPTIKYNLESGKYLELGITSFLSLIFLAPLSICITKIVKAASLYFYKVFYGIEFYLVINIEKNIIEKKLREKFAIEICD